jgi:hypothetical protein
MGVLFLIIHIYIFILLKKVTVRFYIEYFLLFLFSFVEIGYVFDLNGIISLQFFLLSTIIIIFDYFFIFGFNIRINKKFIIYLLLLFVTLLSILNFFIFPPDFNVLNPRNTTWDDIFYNRKGYSSPVIDLRQIKLLFRLLLSMGIYVITINLIEKKVINPYKLIKLYIISAIIIMILGFAESILSLLDLNSFWRNILLNLFGYVGEPIIDLSSRGGISPIISVASEPSHYIYNLFLFFSLVFVDNFYLRNFFSSKKRLYLVVSSIFIIFLTGSAMGFLYFLIMVLFMTFLNTKKAILNFKINIHILSIYLFLISVFIILFLINADILLYYFGRIFSVFNGDEIDDISIAIRVLGIKKNISFMIKRPLLGVGFGVTSAQNFWATLLSNIGIVGTIVYIYLVYIHISTGIKKNYGRIISYSLIILLISYSFSGTISSLLNPIFSIFLALTLF